MRDLHIAVIGAGSTYSPEIFEGIVKRKDSLAVKKITLMDIDREKLDIVGGLIGRMVQAAGVNAELVLTTDLDTALAGADYVLAQIRVGRLPARILDERIPLKYDLMGQETTGIGGFFKGLRTIPVMMHVAKRMEALCPDAVLINFSNPSGLVAEAIANRSKTRMIGLCNNAINQFAELRRVFGENIDIQYVGLNHLTWTTGLWRDGKDIFPEALAYWAEKHAAYAPFLPLCQGLPCGYLHHFYRPRARLAEMKADAEKQTRGEVCVEIEKELLAIYSDKGLYSKPEQLNHRGGALYSEAAVSLVNAIENNLNEIHAINVKNEGALPWMADDDVVETMALINRNHNHALPVRNFQNAHVMELMRTVKAYEKHTAKAALTGDREEAIRALMIHPLVGDAEVAVACFNEMLEAHKEYLPLFFR